ncbi:Phage protein [Collimonas arenae]|uniref:Phage protein n=1 Tax=Collimonas arenae TaxID=279058 RepID=A0A0A1F929_9BURK|nr:ubiquitin-activating E1 FCCH domain-containing protein [Collimonas arenae]AIY40189.1 Phage protein [Collimonas arenae]
MAQETIQPSFAAGEIAPSMYGRVDLAKYHSGAAILRNFFVDYRGGASSRQGKKFVGQCKDSATPNRLIPFTFNTLQTYALVFGNLTMRVVMNGGYVLEPATAITGISQAFPGVITDPAHGYNNGDLVYLTGIVGMTQLNGRFGVVTGATTNTFYLTDMYGVVISTSGYSAYVSGGTVGRVFTLTTPYAGSDLALLKFAQSADVMTLVHPNYTPQKLTRTQHWAWTITPITFTPSVSPPSGPTISNNAVGTVYPTTVYSYVITAVVGGVESLPSAVVSTVGVHALSQNVGAQNTVGWNAVTGAEIYNIYRTQENLNTMPPQGALFGFVGSTNPAASNTFIDNNILPDFTNVPPQGYNPFTVAGNPSCVTYYQQRQVFGGMANAPEQIDFSKTGDFFNMNFAIPSKPDDNIEITIASQQVNAIKHMIPMQSLIVLTSSGAWKVDGGASGTVTPTSIEAVPQAYNGCGDVPPLTINYDILYVQAKGSIVRDLAYNFYVNIYTGTDISLLSNHLFYGHQITEWCWADEPFKQALAVRDDGIMLSLTYLKEQEVYAWTHYDTNGLYKSVCSISEGNENAVYTIVERFINGQYLQYIERFASRQMGGDPTIGLPADVSRAWCVDAGLQYPLTYPAATLIPTEEFNIPVISGVDVIAGGQNYSNLTTATVIDPNGTGATFSVTIVGGIITAITPLAVGGNYTRPILNIFDPTGAGSGAVAQPIVTSPVPMNASAAIFSSANIGNVVRINNGMGIVTSVPSSTQIIVNVLQNLTSIWPAASGAWSMTAPVTQVFGLDHLNGQTVSILADGNVQPNQLVTAGSITLQRPATLITIGLPYICQLQTLYLDVQGDGTIQGKRKKINAVTLRLQDSRGLKVGPNFNQLTEIKDRTTQPMGMPVTLFTGDERVNIEPNWTVPGQIAVQQDWPLPCTILACIPEVTIGDTPQ